MLVIVVIRVGCLWFILFQLIPHYAYSPERTAALCYNNVNKMHSNYYFFFFSCESLFNLYYIARFHKNILFVEGWHLAKFEKLRNWVTITRNYFRFPYLETNNDVIKIFTTSFLKLSFFTSRKMLIAFPRVKFSKSIGEFVNQFMLQI